MIYFLQVQLGHCREKLCSLGEERTQVITRSSRVRTLGLKSDSVPYILGENIPSYNLHHTPKEKLT